MFYLAAIFVLLSIIILGIKILLNYVKKHYGIGYRTKLNLELYSKLFRVKYDKINEKGLMYFLENINMAVNHLNQFLTAVIPSLISMAIMLLVCLIILSIQALWLAPFLIILMLLQYFVYQFINRRLSEKSVHLQQTAATSFSYLLSAVDNLDFLKSKSQHTGLLKLIKPKVYDLHAVTEDVNSYANQMTHVFVLFIDLSQYFLYLYFGYLTLIQQLPISQFVFLSIVVNLFFNHLSSISGISLEFSDTNASWQFINQELEANIEDGSGQTLSAIDTISYKNSTVGYLNQPLLSQVNATLSKGDVVFVKGETGIGKSTLLKGLLGFLEIPNLFINDQPFQTYSITSIRQKIGYVSQNFSLINDTLKNNLLIGEDFALEKILHYAFFKKFVEAGELVDKVVQNKGGNLSGGDKQKVILARTLLQEYDVLILDEVTSSMDLETENLVFSEILPQRKDKITILISHNDALQRFASHIWHIKDGTMQVKQVG